MKNIRGFFMNKKIFFAFITVILIITVISSCKSQNENVEKNIFAAASNINMDMILGFKKDGVKHSFLETYDEEEK